MNYNVVDARNYDFDTYLVCHEDDMNVKYIVIGANSVDQAIDTVINEFYKDEIDANMYTKRELKKLLFGEKHLPIILGKNNEIDRYDKERREKHEKKE